MNIIQLSDLHLIKPGRKLFGLDPYKNFERLCEEIQRIQAAKRIDLLVISGDITHDADISIYQYFLLKIDKLGIPYIALTGNHDNQSYFTKAVKKQNPVYLIRNNEYLNSYWYVTSVDTVIPGKDEGFITQKNLDALETRLLTYLHLNIAIFLHHPPICVGTPLVDNCKLINANALINLCEKYNVKFIGCGHAHTPGFWQYNTMLINVAPAASFQWLPGTENPATSSVFGFNQITLSTNLSVTSCIYNS